jgi:PucR C-terminal helix-turn-helix domain/GGDEF-like domain
MPTATDEDVRRAVSAVATALMPDLLAVGDATADYIAAAMPQLEARGVLELIRVTCHANTSTLLTALLRGVSPEAIAPPPEVVRHTRALVEHGLGHDDVMRGYRLGVIYWCSLWASAVEQHCPRPDHAIAAVRSGTSFLLGWLEIVSEQLSAEFRDEAERRAREGTLARAAKVRLILGGEDHNPRATARAMGYELNGPHIALVVSHDDNHDHHAPLEVIARTLATSLATAPPLVVRADIDTVWCWAPAGTARALSVSDANVLVGQSRPARGLEGFRRSHKEAYEALRVARVANRHGGRVLDFDTVELVALCTKDPADCESFIAARLGPLLETSEQARRLRSTLQAYLATMSFRATAARLRIHHNTVRYRLEQVEELLGHPVDQDRLHLELALHLAHELDAAGHDDQQSRG